jgi:hypothetical protein
MADFPAEFSRERRRKKEKENEKKMGFYRESLAW